jgi:hypothetical protein
VNTDLPEVLRIDGIVTDLADGVSYSVGGGSIERIGHTYAMTTAVGDIISAEDFGDHLDLALTLASGRAPGSLRGLLGNFNQDTSDDLALADGTVLAQPVAFADLYGTFAEDWRVSAANSLFDYAAGENTETFTDRAIPRYEVTLDMLPPAVVAEATRQVDAAGITDPVLRAAAILDFALTNDPNYVVGATNVGGPLAALDVAGQPVAAQSVLTVVSRVDRQAEGNVGATDLVFDIHRSGNTAGDLSVAYRVVGGLLAPVDAADLGGSLPTGVVSFGDGETVRSIAVRIAGDSAIEADEVLVLEISVDPSVRDWVAFATTSATATVANDDGTLAPRFGIAAIAAIQAEGVDGQTTEFTFRVTRSENTRDAATIDFSVSGLDFDPVEADDFVSGSLPAGTLVFGPGESEQTLRLAVAGDDLLERNERFQVTLANPSAGVIGDAAAIGMIVNEDAFVSRHSIGPVERSLAEGNGGLTEFTFSVMRNGNIDVATTVDFSVSPGGSTPADAADFGGSLPTGTVAFAVGEVEKTITISVAGDVDEEADEGFTVSLNHPSSGVVLGSGVTSTIVNDDAPSPSLSTWRIGSNPGEGDSGVAAVQFAVVRTGDLSVHSTVNYAVLADGADPADAADFVGGLSTGTLAFEAGEDFKVLTVAIAGDAALESDEGFRVVLSDASRATIALGEADALIINDDSVLSVALTDDSGKPEGNGGETGFVFTVSRTGALSEEATVAFTVTGGVDAADFVGNALPSGVITFTPGDTQRTVEIRVAGDALVEGDEVFVLQLSSPSNANIGTASASATIVNDDVVVAPELSIVATDASKPEGSLGNTSHLFTVTRTGDLSQATTLGYAVTGTGPNPADPADFGGTLPIGTISFAAGEHEKLLSIAVSSDSTIEPDERFVVTLADVTNGTITTPSAASTIENDDLPPPPTPDRAS